MRDFVVNEAIPTKKQVRNNIKNKKTHSLIRRLCVKTYLVFY